MAAREREGVDLVGALQEVIKCQGLVAQIGWSPGEERERTHLVGEILESLSVVRAALESPYVKQEDGTGDMMFAGSPCSRNGRSEGLAAKRKNKGGDADKIGAQRRRRSSSNSTLRVTSTTTLNDGYPWRKYGQKGIQCTKYPRSYYRCTHKYTRGCQAIRQVQQREDEPLTYNVTYIGHHTCKDATLKPTHQPKVGPAASKPPPALISFGNPKLESSPSFALPQQEIPVVPDVLSDPNGDDCIYLELPDLELPERTSLLMTMRSTDSAGGSEHGDATSSLHAVLAGSTDEDTEFMEGRFDFVSFCMEGNEFFYMPN